ncbi:MAG: hypothetical protein K8T91_10910 [Planctomycetes bacterium]|nr:hypothetical protein [Planctomycetota bacterium]
MTDDQFLGLIDDLPVRDQLHVLQMWKQIAPRLAPGTNAEDDALNFLACYELLSETDVSDTDMLDAIRNFAAEEAASYQRIADSINDRWSHRQRISLN